VKRVKYYAGWVLGVFGFLTLLGVISDFSRFEGPNIDRVQAFGGLVFGLVFLILWYRWSIKPKKVDAKPQPPSAKSEKKERE
jgi:membrane associated rhomboid family serine protease